MVMIDNTNETWSFFAFTGGEDVVADGGQLSQQVEGGILFLALEKLFLKAVGVAKNVDVVLIFLGYFFLVLEKFSCAFEDILFFNLHLSLFLFGGSFHIECEFLFAKSLQKLIGLFNCIFLSSFHVEGQFPVMVTTEQQRAKFLTWGYAPDMAAAVKRSSDEGLVLMDKFNSGDAVMMCVVYF